MTTRSRAWRAGGTRALCALMPLVGVAFLGAHDAGAQQIQGRVTDAENGAPVGLAAIFLLDAERNPVARGGADVDGRYTIGVPGAGEYYLIVERLGYFENESPLLSVAASGDFGVDIEMRPEPIRLDPLQITVENEKLENFLTLEFGVNPISMRGYRAIQGARLEAAKLAAVDNTDVLRKLYIPVSHGINVCIGSYGPGAELPERMSHERVMARSEARDSDAPCGALYVDGYRCRNEHIEEIVMDRIAVVVTLPSAVHMYTREFDWTYRPGGGTLGC